ncbi:MAG: UPF0146 family protein [Methanobacterium sp.]|jgi:uncharacterized UPF0146 family protein
MWKDFAQYIIDNYADADRIVEVGAGKFDKVGSILQKNLKANIVLTDIKPSSNKIVQDDICNPDLKIYKGSSLIYSIRPQPELQLCIIKVAENVGADLIIKPFSTEFVSSNKMKLLNYRKVSFYKMSK